MVSSSWFRRHQKTVYIVMIFAMFVWGIGYSAIEMLPKKAIGKVYGRKVTQEEFADMANRWYRLFFSQSQDSVVSLVWKQLLLVEEAKRIGLEITMQEIEEGLSRIALQVFGQQPEIDKPRLVQFLCNTFKLNQEQLFRTLKEALLVEKLDSIMRTSTKLTTDEAWQRYAMENEQVKFKVFTLKAKDFLDSVTVDEDEIIAYYTKYKNNEFKENTGLPGYRLPERVRLECLIAKYEDMEKWVSVSDEEMRKYYEDNKDGQFLFVASDKKTDGAENGESMTRDELSVNEETVKDEQEKGDGGEMAVQESPEKYRPFGEAKDEIHKILASQKAREKAAEVIHQLDEEIYEAIDTVERPSFQDLAAKYSIKYEIPESKAAHDEFLTENDFWDLFPGSDQIVKMAFERAKYEPSVPLDYVEGKIIFQIIDKKRSEPAPFEEVQNRVIADLKMEKGLLKAEEIVTKIAGTGNISFDSAVQTIKAENALGGSSVVEVDYISRPTKLFNRESRYIEALKEDRPNVARKAFELKPGQLGIATETFGEKACYLMQLVDKKPADRADFENRQENLAKRYLFEKQEAFLAAWKNDLSRHMEIYTKFQ
ncbi:MAG: SurA N-terminal domain-containing protein [Candidatus Brocadiaceae bacterium]|nr:SurA N-terminal domain-containing protein [Candidatus Brocadiaceae bacterium]